ncbi:unnamed protein product, partial [marine sediment metagenome]
LPRLLDLTAVGCYRGSDRSIKATFLTVLRYVELVGSNGDITPNPKIRQSPPIKLFFPKGGENSFSGGHLLP